MVLQSKMTVYVAIAGVLVLMGGIVYYASLDNVELEQVEIKLTKIELRDINTKDNQAKVDVTFLITNPSDKAFTVAIIDYEIFGDEMLLGSGQYSTIDIALPGRAVIYPGTEVPLKNTFVLNKSEMNEEIYQNAIENKFTNFSAAGLMTTQTSWSTSDKEFQTSIN